MRTSAPALRACSSGINAVPFPSGRSKVEECHINAVDLLPGLGKRAGLGHHSEARLLPQDKLERLPKDGIDVRAFTQR
jgi:hypothetical protein